MSTGGKTSWRDLTVHRFDADVLEAPESLAALYRFQTGQTLQELYVVAAACEVVGDPGEVDWAGFPVVHALEAVTADELRRLRSLILEGARERPPTKTREELPTPPQGFDWSFYLGNVSVSSASEC